MDAWTERFVLQRRSAVKAQHEFTKAPARRKRQAPPPGGLKPLTPGVENHRSNKKERAVSGPLPKSF